MTGTRDRILDATSQLFRLQGYAGTAMKQVVDAAGAPFGSVYHFFPGGKEQLAVEAIERAGKGYEDIVLLVFDAEPDVIAGTRAIFEGAGEVLRQSGYADACPIATSPSRLPAPTSRCAWPPPACSSRGSSPSRAGLATPVPNR